MNDRLAEIEEHYTDWQPILGFNITDVRWLIAEVKRLRGVLISIRDFEDWTDVRDTPCGDTEQAMLWDVGSL